MPLIPATQPLKVLAIDGGGIRGVIPAMVLAEIERQTAKPVSSLFDLVVGTSTGSLLALGLTLMKSTGAPKYSAQDLVQVYIDLGQAVFVPSACAALRNLFRPKYSDMALENVLRVCFAHSRLKDARPDVLITGYEIERRKPWVFSSREARIAPQDHDYSLVQVCVATSAAPTYFRPAKLLSGNDSDYLAIVDGGLFANNPGLYGFVEARRMYPRRDVILASLGTGSSLNPILYDDASGWGLAKWAQPILAIVFDGVSAAVDEQLACLLPHTRYFRFQTELRKCTGKLDDARASHIRKLQLRAERLLSREKDRILELCQLLLQ
jgi:patatin-like phospholipase/acyl hydrolase